MHKGDLIKGIRGLARYYKIGMNRAYEISKNKSIPKYQMGNCFYYYSNEIDEYFRVRNENEKQQSS